MEKGTSRGIWRVKREDYKLTHTCSTEKRRKIPSENRCFRIYYRSSIPRTRKKMEIYCIFIKDNAIYGTKLWDL